MMRRLTLYLIIVLATPSAFAAQLTKVKGSSALITLQGESFSPGELYYAVENGKKKALLRIDKVNGNQAIAKIVKGTAREGMTLEKGKTSNGTQAKRSSGPGSAGGKSRAYWGGLLGYAMDTMSVNVNSSTNANTSLGTAALSGSGFSGKALFDYELFDQLWFRGTSGIEQFNVTGTSMCGTLNREACDAKIMYLTLDFIGRYMFSMKAFRPWLGGGVGLLFPASKSSTALSSSSIGTTNVILVTGGFDYFTSSTMYIPVSLEYGLLPKSDEVDAHWISLRVGIGFAM